MEVGWLYRIITLIILLVLSALFSGSEVALFSLDKKKLAEINKGAGLVDKYVSKLILFPRKLLVTILIGNTICNVAASIIAVSLAIDIADKYKYPVDLLLLIQIIVLTIVIILFAEITPKVWANKHPVYFSKIIAIPLYWTNFVISPVSNFLTNVLKYSTSKIKFDKSKTALSTSEITDLADIVVAKGTIEEEEHGLIHGLVAFKTVVVREVMTPRVDMVSANSDIIFSELIELIKESGNSRIPVFEEDLDSIIGIIYAKDLLPFIKNKVNENRFNIKKIIRDCTFVPETKLISTLMHEFQDNNTHISIVVDEYGGTAGLITLEDILEEIVGEIRDEYDNEEEEITELSKNKYVMFGKVAIDELEDKLEIAIDVPDDDFETLGGYIFNQAGTIPKIGYKFEEYGYSFKVTEIDNNRINKVFIEKLD